MNIESVKKVEIFPNNKQEHFDLFISNIRDAYPNANFGVYYIYGNEVDSVQRECLQSSECFHAEPFPAWQTGNKKMDHWNPIIDMLKKIKLSSRDEIKPFKTEKIKFYKL